ncbi:MAG: hypothetical protein IIX01_03390, partial [Clostridia bacterium]|nr:hypothetical protein [Clostridia bacterium]
ICNRREKESFVAYSSCNDTALVIASVRKAISNLIKNTKKSANFLRIFFFSHQFKEYIGVSPTEFIKRYVSSR